MPVECKLCGSWRHSDHSCTATPEGQLGYALNNMAILWMATEINGDGEYFAGRQSAIRQCGEDLRDRINKLLGDTDGFEQSDSNNQPQKNGKAGVLQHLHFSGLPKSPRSSDARVDYGTT